MADQGDDGISWTDVTWNPIRGCRRKSAGCVNCYAEVVATRFSGTGQAYEGLTTNGRWNGTIRVIESHMYDPIRWQKPRRVFVNSMSDLFYEDLSDDDIDRIFAVMALAPQHTFQVLTKRADRMHAYMNGRLQDGSNRRQMTLQTVEQDVWQRAEHIGRLHRKGKKPFRWCIGWPYVDMTPDQKAAWLKENNQLVWPGWPLPNVHLGVSIENRAALLERAPLLADTPAAVRWWSAEPLIGDLGDLSPFLGGCTCNVQALDGAGQHAPDCPATRQRGVEWIVAGGESGPHWRDVPTDAFRSIRDQAAHAGVAFHMKQMPNRTPIPTDLQIRQYPGAQHAA